MPTNSLVLIRPAYELVTRYGAAWQLPILNTSSQVGMANTDLYGTDATRLNFEQAIASSDPILVSIMGHGDRDIIACQDGEILLQSGVNDEILAGRVVYDLSCRSGGGLGYSALALGAVSFLGYTEDFWICYTTGNHADGGMSNPLDDELARGFFESHNKAPISYIQGSTIPASYSASQSTSNYWINVWEQMDSQVAALLVWNRDYQILHFEGELEAPSILPALLMFAPLLLIPVLKKK